MNTKGWKYQLGDKVQKKSGSNWHGAVVGFYSTELTQRGYAVESMFEKGSTQIYPEAALEFIELYPQ
jgi:R67 dihydrofolate reductase